MSNVFSTTDTNSSSTTAKTYTQEQVYSTYPFDVESSPEQAQAKNTYPSGKVYVSQDESLYATDSTYSNTQSTFSTTENTTKNPFSTTKNPFQSPVDVKALFSDGKLDDAEYAIIQKAYSEWVAKEATQGRYHSKTLEEAKANLNGDVDAFAKAYGLNQTEEDILWAKIPTQSSVAKPLDLNKNNKIDTFEQTAANELGINTTNSDINKIITIADTNHDGIVTETEYNAVKGYLDLDSDHNVTNAELDLVAYITKLNQQSGIQYPEEVVLATIRTYLTEQQKAGKPIDIESNLTELKEISKAIYEWTLENQPAPKQYTFNFDPASIEFKEDFEKLDTYKGNPDNDLISREAMTNYLTEFQNQYPHVKPEDIAKIINNPNYDQIDYTEFKTITNQLKYLAKGQTPPPKYSFNFVAGSKDYNSDFEKLDTYNNNPDYPNNNMISRTAMNDYLYEFQNQYPHVAPEDIAKIMNNPNYDQIDSTEFKKITQELNKLVEELYTGTVPAPEVHATGYRQVPKSELNDVISGKLPLAHVDMNYNYSTGPEDYTQLLLDVLYADIKSGKISEAEAKKSYDAIITEFRKSGHPYSQHPVTPWNYKK